MKRITTLSLLLTILLAMVTACHAHNATSHNDFKTLSTSQEQNPEKLTLTHGDDCPCEPAQPQQADHNCGHACHGPCHAPLAGSPITFSCVLLFTILHPIEITWYIPKVYLSLFVPPDSANV